MALKAGRVWADMAWQGQAAARREGEKGLPFSAFLCSPEGTVEADRHPFTARLLLSPSFLSLAIYLSLLFSPPWKRWALQIKGRQWRGVAWAEKGAYAMCPPPSPLSWRWSLCLLPGFQKRQWAIT